MARDEKNTRRYPRVFSPRGGETLTGLLVEWTDGSQTGVLDLSYIGAAIVKSSKVTVQVNKGDQVEFKFLFQDIQERVSIPCEVIRSDQKTVAIHFADLALGARRVLEKFLKTKLIGMNTHLVDPKFYIKEQGFDFWFHGPSQTNIFVWGSAKEIKKATFEVNNEVVSFENEKFYSSESKSFLDLPTEDYAYRVNNPDSKTPITKKEKIVSEISSLLSQMKDETGVIKKLLDVING